MFTACLEEILRKLEWKERRMKIGDEHLRNPRFTGDINRIFLSESPNELQQLINDKNRESLKR